jgi:hypothetical protein
MLLTLISFLQTPVCNADAAEPPSILIIVSSAPQDLKISTGTVTAYRKDKGLESYFTFYLRDLVSTDYVFTITTGDKTFDIKTATPLNRYNNIYTLDLSRQTLTPGKTLWRSFSFLSLRIIFTLVIEGVVFYLFGYRKKKSWIVFLIVNLITQGILYFSLNRATPLDTYVIWSLILGEIVVFIVETAAFLILINERSRWLTLLYVILANILSLIVGAYLFTLLPI